MYQLKRPGLALPHWHTYVSERACVTDRAAATYFVPTRLFLPAPRARKTRTVPPVLDLRDLC
jgi:hypothetical protein